MASNIQTADEIIDEVLEEFGSKVELFTEDEAWKTFDGHAWFALNMSGEEFLKRWDAGEWKDDPDQPGVMGQLMLMPLIGRRLPLEVDDRH